MTEADIIICGHGSGLPSTKNLRTYNSNRYSQIAANGVRKGLVSVRRLKGLTETDQVKFHDTFKSILGRNLYSQSLRTYCYTPYSDGRYYSDCSSAICLTLKQIGKSVSSYNTAGIYLSPSFEDVPAIIDSGHILNPEVLQVGDCLLYAGDNPARPLQIGHVEAVYELPGKKLSSSKSTSGASSTINLGARSAIRNYKKWLNTYYASLVKTATGSKLPETDEYDNLTRSASITVWKYMANKYYSSNLTIGNLNFFSSCRSVAAKITTSEVSKHSTLVVILQGLLAGRGYYGGAIDGKMNPMLVDSIRQARRIFKLADSSEIDSTLWYKLFN